MVVHRPYQLQSVEAAFREWQTVRSTLIILATGGGKSAVFAEVFQRFQPKRGLLLVHREELAHQGRHEILKFSGLESCIEMGALEAKGDLFGSSPVVVATVQTLNSARGDRTRMSRFNPKDFGVVVVDEAHHIVASTYQNVVNYFVTGNPDIKILSVTATADRSDGAAMSQMVDSVAIDIGILDLIEEGWLVPVEQRMVHVEGLDFSHIKTTMGDLNSAQLAEVMEAEGPLHQVASSSIQIIGSKRSLVFAVSVAQAEKLCEIFNRHRPGMAEFVSGKTPREKRAEILERFKRGEIQVVCNCAVLTEGFNDPGVEVIIMARPTKSRALYTQMVGRSTRPLPGVVDGYETPEARRAAIAYSAKPSCLIVDHAGNAGKHKLVSTADVLGGRVSDEAKTRAVARAKKAKGAVNMQQLLHEEEEKLIEERRQAKLVAEAKRARLVAKVRFSTTTVNPFDAFDLSPVRMESMRGAKPLSEGHRMLLIKQNIDPDKLTVPQQRRVLNDLFAKWARWRKQRMGQ